MLFRSLRQFLSDPRVLDIPALGRWLLLNLIILPFRPRRSAEAYRKIWQDSGSPLLRHSLDLRDAVAERLGPEVPGALGMRYGRPSLDAALRQLVSAGAEEIVVLPLYPQYASSSTGSSLEHVYRLAAAEWNVPPLRAVGDFHDHPEIGRAHV